MAAKNAAIPVGLVLFAGIGLTVRFCARAVMHSDANELIARVCDDAVGKPMQPPLASALGATMTKNLGHRESAWLSCVAEEQPSCAPAPTFKVGQGIFSALPRRYWVDVDVDHGVVRACQITHAPGW